ncbi:MAG: hypothetical protein LBG92_00955 [Prevotellaceae bacterium]|jgi:hypothetical protein|nr:hypothetical protein [Prevotellaceae bacterium]
MKKIIWLFICIAVILSCDETEKGNSENAEYTVKINIDELKDIDSNPVLCIYELKK